MSFSLTAQEVEQYLKNAALLFIAANGAALIIALTSHIPALTKSALAWIQAHIALMKDQRAAGILSRLTKLIGSEVLCLEQTEMQVIKSDLASGSITKAKAIQLAQDLKAKAIANVKAKATAQGLLADVKYVVFNNDSASMESMLATEVEAAVGSLPPSGLQSVVAALASAPASPAVPGPAAAAAAASSTISGSAPPAAR